MKQLSMLLAMLLVFPAAFADDPNHCRKINGKAVFQDFQLDSELDGIEYDACFIAKVCGNPHFVHDWLFDASDGGAPIPTFVTGGTGIYEYAGSRY